MPRIASEKNVQRAEYIMNMVRIGARENGKFSVTTAENIIVRGEYQKRTASGLEMWAFTIEVPGRPLYYGFSKIIATGRLALELQEIENAN